MSVNNKRKHCRTLCRVVIIIVQWCGCMSVVSKSKRIKYFSLFCTIFIRHGGDWGRPTTSRDPGCPIFTTWHLFCYHLINCGINSCKSRAQYYLVYMTRMIDCGFFFSTKLASWLESSMTLINTFFQSSKIIISGLERKSMQDFLRWTDPGFPLTILF